MDPYRATRRKGNIPFAEKPALRHNFPTSAGGDRMATAKSFHMDIQPGKGNSELVFVVDGVELPRVVLDGQSMAMMAAKILDTARVSAQVGDLRPDNNLGYPTLPVSGAGIPQRDDPDTVVLSLEFGAARVNFTIDRHVLASLVRMMQLIPDSGPAH
jgi:hypothetical protein